MPEYEISVDMPNRPDGEEIQVPPYGVIDNRGDSITVEISKDDADTLAKGYGITVQGRKKKGGEA